MNWPLGKRIICIFLCVAILISAAACSGRGKQPEEVDSGAESTAEEVGPREAFVPDLEDVTAGIDFEIKQELEITRPSEDIVIYAENYYITGTSDPGVPLLLNGIEVQNRGEFGSFGLFEPLDDGENIFAFTQGEAGKTVTITCRADDEEIYTTDIITKPSPTADDVIRAGESYTLRCTAPSGAAVAARVQGKTIPLEQRAVTAVEGVPTVFAAEFVPDTGAVTENIGPVTYTLVWQGAESDYTSEGSLFAAGNSSPLLVRVKDVSATVFVEESVESDYFANLKRGAVDEIIEIGTDMYKLSIGGWAVKSSLEPLTDETGAENKITGASFSGGEPEGIIETLTLEGSAAAPYRAEQKDGKLIFRFHRASFTGKTDKIKLKDSKLFSGAQILNEGEDMIVELGTDEKNPPWGYLVEYNENGILLNFRRAPKISKGGGPLQGVTVAIDPGHGGDDPGALGVARNSGAAEKDISLAASKAAQAYLEALGAHVYMTREGDETVDMNGRLEIFLRPEVDFIVSLHCNSIPYGSDGSGPSGTEVYYYEEAAAPLAEAILKGVCERTGRNDRGARQANYKITLNSNAPSVMVEMGFMTNPEEYDNLRGKQAVYDTAAAIAEGILSCLPESA